MNTPAFYRARLQAIRDAIRTADESELRFLRNGYMPGLVIADHSGYDDHPLSFLEITSFDTWFAMHPEKVCGQTVTTTSRAFPLAVKATKEDVIRTIRQTDVRDIRIRLAKAKFKLLRLKF